MFRNHVIAKSYIFVASLMEPYRNACAIAHCFPNDCFQIGQRFFIAMAHWFVKACSRKKIYPKFLREQKGLTAMFLYKSGFRKYRVSCYFPSFFVCVNTALGFVLAKISWYSFSWIFCRSMSRRIVHNNPIRNKI